jgi:hypothetical protein
LSNDRGAASDYGRALDRAQLELLSHVCKRRRERAEVERRQKVERTHTFFVNYSAFVYGVTS